MQSTRELSPSSPASRTRVLLSSRPFGDGKISARAICGRPIPLLGSARRCMLIELALAELTLSPACRPVPLDERLMARHPWKLLGPSTNPQKLSLHAQVETLR
ncbi:hypothetical protein VTO73DRAFT_5331 [Trametes versicolor]